MPKETARCRTRVSIRERTLLLLLLLLVLLLLLLLLLALCNRLLMGQAGSARDPNVARMDPEGVAGAGMGPVASRPK